MGKVVLITGGAKGIGRAIALALAKEGYDIAINYLTSSNEANSLYHEIIDKYHVNAITIKADVSKVNEVDKLVSEVEDYLGPVDILINNAAIESIDFFKNKKVEDFKRVLDVNLIGAYNTSKRVYKNMLDNKWGRIINISSTNGINTYYPVNLEYDASKAALISLTHNLAIELAPYVTVNAIAPGFIGTEKELKDADEEYLRQETEKILVGRYGKPEEVASLVKFLVSDEASFINNTVIRIDGGQYNS